MRMQLMPGLLSWKPFSDPEKAWFEARKVPVLTDHLWNATSDCLISDEQRNLPGLYDPDQKTKRCLPYLDTSPC